MKKRPLLLGSESYLLKGDPFHPKDYDVVAQVKTVANGDPPTGHGWTFFFAEEEKQKDGNWIHVTSTWSRVTLRSLIEKEHPL